MLYDYIVANYEKDEPIFLAELPGKSKESIRQEMKRLTDEGKIEKLYDDVYHLSYKTILGTKGKVSFDKFVRKRFLQANGKTIGYITGLQLANMYGFTTQNPSCYEVCSNEATAEKDNIYIYGRKIIVYKPVTEISKENRSALQFLELMSTIDRHSEISGGESTDKIRTFIDAEDVDFQEVKKYISMFPDRAYQNICEAGLMDELI